MNDGSAQNALPDASFMLQNAPPAVPGPGIPDMLQAVNPSPPPMPMHVPMSMPMASPEMGGLLPNAFPPMMPAMDFSANRFGQAPVVIPDNSMRVDQMMTDPISARVREQQHQSLPRGSLDAVNTNLLNVDQVANMVPLGSSSR